MEFAVGKSGVVVKGAQKMSRVNVPLDPSRTGRDAEALEASLRRLIVGQDEAIQQIVNIYQMNLTGMTPPGRPIGNFLFLGPTGSGKTRIVEAISAQPRNCQVDRLSSRVLGPS
jgi:ATP-dependent Clp protease ATP-binding subunit ClpA